MSTHKAIPWKYQEIILREWRAGRGYDDYEALFALVADQRLGWRGLIAVVLTGTFCGTIAGLVVGILITDSDVFAPFEWDTQWTLVQPYVLWGSGIGAGTFLLVGILTIRWLKWKHWLPLWKCSPHSLKDHSRVVLGVFTVMALSFSGAFSLLGYSAPDLAHGLILREPHGALAIGAILTGIFFGRRGLYSGLFLGLLFGFFSALWPHALPYILGICLFCVVSCLLREFYSPYIPLNECEDIAFGLLGVVILGALSVAYVFMVVRQAPVFSLRWGLLFGLVCGLGGGVSGMVAGILAGRHHNGNEAWHGAWITSYTYACPQKLRYMLMKWWHCRHEFLPWSWRHPRPSILEVQRAIEIIGDHRFSTLLQQAKERLEDPRVVTGGLQSFIVCCRNVELGAEVVARLNWQWPDNVWVLRTISRETTHRLAQRTSRLLCPHCLARCVAHKVHISRWRHVRFYGCRVCKQSREFIEHAGEVVAVLDGHWNEERRQTDGVLGVNWHKRRTIFDFDKVEILQATDEDVERFCVQVANDSDRYRRKRYRKIPVTIASSCPLSENSLRILRSAFGKVTAIP